MKVTVLQEELTKALSLASKFVNNKAQLPILGNILFSTSGTKLYLSATNLEMSLSTSIGAKVDEEGEIAIPSRVVLELVGNLGKGQILLNAKKEKLKIEKDGFFADVLGVNTSDFPFIAKNLEGSLINFPTEEFLDVLSQIIFAVSEDQSRPVLTGVLFIFDKNKLTLVATDGFRLSMRSMSLKENLPEGFSQKIILPKSSLSELVKIAAGTKEISFTYKKEENQVIFEVGDSIVATRIIEGDFPNFEKIIPKTKNTSINISKEDFLRAVKLSSVFARESSNSIKLVVKNGSVELYAESSSSGREQNIVEVKSEGPEIEIIYNFKFLEDFLNSCKGEDVVVEFTDTTSPGVFRDVTRADFLHLIMPVRG